MYLILSKLLIDSNSNLFWLLPFSISFEAEDCIRVTGSQNRRCILKIMSSEEGLIPPFMWCFQIVVSVSSRGGVLGSAAPVAYYEKIVELHLLVLCESPGTCPKLLGFPHCCQRPSRSLNCSKEVIPLALVLDFLVLYVFCLSFCK